MQPEAGLFSRLWVRVAAGLYQLRLEIKVVTGGRAPVLAIVSALWFALIALWERFDDDPWSAATHYNAMMLVPGTILVVALAMVSVVGDRDSHQLEVTFVSPTGRHQAWALRFAAVLLAAWLSTGVLSVLTWLLVDRSHQPLEAWLHVFVPLFFAMAFTVLSSVLFKSASVAGLCTAALLAVFVLFNGIRRISYWFNPFDVPPGQEDPEAFFRMIVHNRAGFLVVAGLLMAGAFALLQRRERLL